MREVAWRVLSNEYNESTFFLEGEGNLSPNYVVTPLGAKINRVFIVGVLTEVQDLNKGTRARISDPAGVFSVYAGIYQSKIASILSDLDPPEFVSVTGKANIYSKDDGQKLTNIRPESINIVEEIDRDSWNIEAIKSTLDRIKKVEKALNGEKINKNNIYSLGDLREIIDYYSLDFEYIEDMRRKTLDILTKMFDVDIDELKKRKHEGFIDDEEIKNKEKEKMKETIVKSVGIDSKDEIEDKDKKIEISDTRQKDKENESSNNQKSEVGDPEKLVLDVIETKGDGLRRYEVVEKAKTYGLNESEARNALESLLLDGLCYETDEGVKSL